jgi:hypothetical protein
VITLKPIKPVISRPHPVLGNSCRALERIFGNGSNYRGKQQFTKSGKMCQNWTSQSPQKHTRTPSKRPKAGLAANFCRNPDGHKTIWCYTNDPKKRWEECAPRTKCPVVITFKPTKPVISKPHPHPTLGNRCRSLERMFGNGKNYRGQQQFTKSGKIC